MCKYTIYPVGSRVVIRGHSEWPDDTIGTVAEFPEFLKEVMQDNGESSDIVWLYRIEETRNGPVAVQWVEFDEPTDDGSGGSPYRAAVVAVGTLFILDRGE